MVGEKVVSYSIENTKFSHSIKLIFHLGNILEIDRYQVHNEENGVSYCFAEQWCAKQSGGRLIAKDFRYILSTFQDGTIERYAVGITSVYKERYGSINRWALSWGSEDHVFFESDADFIEDNLQTDEKEGKDKNCFELSKNGRNYKINNIHCGNGIHQFVCDIREEFKNYTKQKELVEFDDLSLQGNNSQTCLKKLQPIISIQDCDKKFVKLKIVWVAGSN